MQCSCISLPSNLKLGPSVSKFKLSSNLKVEAIDLAARISLPSHVKAITSTSNPFVKHCVKLRFSSSYRHFHGSVIVVGATPIRSPLNALLSTSVHSFVLQLKKSNSSMQGFAFWILFVDTFHQKGNSKSLNIFAHLSYGLTDSLPSLIVFPK